MIGGAKKRSGSSTVRSVHVHFEHRTPYSKSQWNQLISDKKLEIEKRQKINTKFQTNTNSGGGDLEAAKEIITESSTTTTPISTAAAAATPTFESTDTDALTDTNPSSSLPGLRALAIEEIGTFLQWSSKRYHAKEQGSASQPNAVKHSMATTTKTGENIDWFLESQWYRNPQDLYIGNHICDGGGKYFKRMERASRNGSTVVDIFIPPPSFKPVSLFLSRSHLSKTPKQVIF